MGNTSKGYRRPDAFGGETYSEDPKAPSMYRSKVQLATSYAPGVLMTWEGGKGICRTVPATSPIEIPRNTRKLIFEGMREIASNWLLRVKRVVDYAPAEFALDHEFLDSRSGLATIDETHFEMSSPEKIGYVPYPLLYRCAECGSVEEFSSVAEQARIRLRTSCTKPTKHRSRWTQVDVVYVHWHGELEPLSPFNHSYDPETRDTKQLKFCTCGHRKFRLKNDGPVFSDWTYVCEGCGKPRKLKKADPLVLRRLQADQDEGGRTFEYIEVNMLPVSYRANNAFYPQRSSFIEFADEGVLDLMTSDRDADLIKRLSEMHQIPFIEPTDEEIQAALRTSSLGDLSEEWVDYSDLLRMAERNRGRGAVDMARGYERQAQTYRNGWFTRGIVQRGGLTSPAIKSQVDARRDWAPKYDPIRLTVQHDAFQKEHIAAAKEDNLAVDVMAPDVTLTDVVNDGEAFERYKEDIGGLLGHLGVERLILLRGLPICDYSFGYTRVSATPVYNREYQGRAVPMPVRLKAFDPLPSTPPRRPVYVTRQRNEALYFKLDEARVRRWLKANQVVDLPEEGVGLGRALLETYTDFGPFMEEFKDREGGSLEPRAIGSYIYLLLHSLSHQMMHSLADTSGIDRDGIGEHLFPADLAFVIYRKGMTPDLGNISAMWRNHALDFLRRGIDPRLLRCGSGSLCDSRGGACPACIMVSEVSCISSNVLLSRAALRGGAKPMWERTGAPDLLGYFDRSLDG